MNNSWRDIINDKWILDNRGSKNQVNWDFPYAWHVEKERTATGEIEETGTIFLTNSECPFHCLMCDLWKNTTDKPVPLGTIPNQIEWALQQMPRVKHLKLYNSGSFFDGGAIPRKDFPKIANLLEGYETVIVESHTRFINENVLLFKNLLKAELQVAVGLETVHPEILPLLNKRMTTEDFRKSIHFLNKNNIKSRAFILHPLPFISEKEGILWAKKSMEFAFEAGVECCIIIPMRPGNGAIEKLMESGNFQLPRIASLEEILDYGIALKAGRVFVDLWDLKKFSNCNKCFPLRKNRLNRINLYQQNEVRISCSCNV